MAQRPTTTCTKFRLITTMGVMVNGPFLTKIFAELKTEKRPFASCGHLYKILPENDHGR